jgi:PAS domain S-box-containing protein
MNLRFAQFFEACGDAMLIVTASEKISQANAAAESLFGQGRYQLRGQPASRLFPGQSLRLQPGPGPEAAAAWYVEVVGQRADHSQFPAQVQVIPVTTDQGPADLLSVRDIAEQQRAQFVLGLGLDVLRSADREREALLGHLFRAQEEERGRIAAGIHDDTLQLLTAASRLLERLRFLLHDARQLQLLQRADDTLRLSMGCLRQRVIDLRPAVTDNESVARALRTCLDGMRADNGTAYQLDDSRAVQASASANMVIYQTAREGLTNVRKHARAATVRVQLLDIGHGSLVRITDDGVGYSPAEVEAHDRGHLGLILMRERVQTAGGWCRIESAPGAGTAVEFWVPLGASTGQPETGDGRAE